MRASRLKSLAPALLLASGILIGLLSSEVAYRVARRFVCLNPGGNIFEARPWGWTHAPSTALPMHGCIGRRFEWRTFVAFNSHGLRDRELPYEKPPGARRVLLLGDSATEALQVPLELTFAKLLEARLRSGGTAVEVINAGHAGFGTDNELLFYRQEGQRYAPDVVVLVFNFQNDIVENSQTLYQRSYERADVHFPPKPWFRLDADDTLHELPAPPRATTTTRWQILSGKFFLLRAVSRWLAPAPPARPAVVAPLNYEVYAPPDPEWSEAWRLTFRLIRDLRASVEQRGARFAIALLPDKLMANPASFAPWLRLFWLAPERYDLDRPRRAMIDFLTAERIPLVDLLPALQRSGTTGQTFYEGDVHMNQSGHAAVAPRLAEVVDRQLDTR